jgi:hypothetical protein
MPEDFTPVVSVFTGTPPKKPFKGKWGIDEGRP